ncbi:MAG TPA: hypothetical protein VIA06_04305 [Candidatus Dormibacteraeota bacterium]|nr:hypothetical protein [Candidatus Dormibacteraeota bacterium]
MIELRESSPLELSGSRRSTRQWSQTAILYAIIDGVRRTHRTAAAEKTLDILVEELGRTRENLLEALAALRRRALPVGALEVLGEVAFLASRDGVDDIRMPLPEDEWRKQLEPLDGGQIGIALILGFSAVMALTLTALVIVQSIG